MSNMPRLPSSVIIPPETREMVVGTGVLATVLMRQGKSRLGICVGNIYRPSGTDWKEPAFDILSDPRPQPGADAPPISVDGPGIIDQALFFCSYVRYFTDGTVPVIVTAGPFGTVDDPAGENALYKHYLDIEFRDGLYTIEECPTLDGAIMRMQTIELI